MKYDVSHALPLLRPEGEWSLMGSDYEGVTWFGPGDPPTREEVENKVAELDAAEPIRLLRLERDRKLAECDWWAVADRTMTDAQKQYRQALRDITLTASPVLLANGLLDPESVSWPSKP